MLLSVLSRRENRCQDSRAKYYFDNGASVHYFFAHAEEDKRIAAALEEHNTTLASYDAVFANPGNDPIMDYTHVMAFARAAHSAGVPFFWLTTYDGKGGLEVWDETERSVWASHGARFVPVHEMVASLGYLTKGTVESAELRDEHFCMPGPPNEIALLLLQMAWAVHLEAE